MVVKNIAARVSSTLDKELSKINNKRVKIIDAQMKKLGKTRDDLDEAISDLGSLKDDCEEAYYLLRDARDRLSKMV